MTDPEERKFLHDLASPLGASLFLVDLLKDEPEAKRLRELLLKMKSMIEERRIRIRSNESGSTAA